MRTFVALLLAGSLAACGGSAQSERKGPNVVLVVIDTLRPDHLGFGGYSRETAPFLASLAAEGTVFDRAYSTSSWTAPATASIFSGLWPPRHGVLQGFFAHFKDATDGGDGAPRTLSVGALATGSATLPEVFKAQGYRTFALTTNINIGPEIGFDRGFERFERLDNLAGRKVLAHLEAWRPELMAENERPYLLYLHFNDVHSPYHPRKRWYSSEGDERARRMSAYDSEISYLDGVLESLFERLEIGPGTLVAIVSDHGEEFLEHGRWYHGFSLHRELNQVLFLLRAPGLGVPARRVPVNVSLVDILPTLAELAGLDLDRDQLEARSGRSLAPLLLGAEAGESALAQFALRPIYAHRELLSATGSQETWAVMRGGWKLLLAEGQRKLYDLWRDPAEVQDLSAQEPALARELWRLLEAEMDRGNERAGGTNEVILDRDLLERLSSLGYTD
jgi:arylsulfatase A-like enzyme